MNVWLEPGPGMSETSGSRELGQLVYIMENIYGIWPWTRKILADHLLLEGR